MKSKEFNMQRRVIGYARVNVCSEAILERQISRLQGAGVSEIISDIKSGTSKERIGLNHLIALIQSDQVEEVVVTNVDRLTRSLILLEQILDICRAKGVSIRVLEQNLSNVRFSQLSARNASFRQKVVQFFKNLKNTLLRFAESWL
jgi:DNA invertase Pin-like site-specific DNA recombinase